jgi:uncharacterized protein (DUF433 family)
MPSPTLNPEHIAIDPHIRFGKPHLIGTRITVEDIATLHLQMGQPLTTIAQDYNLSLASLQAAIDYYHQHQTEIDQRRAEGKAWAENYQRHHSSPSMKKEYDLANMKSRPNPFAQPLPLDDQKRAALIKDIQQAQQEFAEGKCHPVIPAQLMQEILE